MHARDWPIVALLCLGLAPAAMADSRTPAKFIAGWVEKITLLPRGNVAKGDLVKAKLDTGARTSSINALNIERFKRDGERWVRFELSYETVAGEKRSVPMERPLERRIRVKEHDRNDQSRLVVTLELCINAQRHEAEFSLTDRSHFVYPVLLGRRFLADVAIVDPAETFLAKAGCGQSDPPDGT